jgi:hypothetical protein
VTFGTPILREAREQDAEHVVNRRTTYNNNNNGCGSVTRFFSHLGIFGIERFNVLILSTDFWVYFPGLANCDTITNNNY